MPYLQLWINTHLVHMWVFMAAGQCMYSWLNINYSAHVVKKEDVTQTNSVVHWFLNSFLTTVKLCGRGEYDIWGFGNKENNWQQRVVSFVLFVLFVDKKNIVYVLNSDIPVQNLPAE